MKVFWTVEARERLAEIYAYVARDNPVAAEHLVLLLCDSAEPLSVHPRMGRVVPEWGREDLRERVIDAYRLVYRLREDVGEIHVLTVFEGHRLLRDEDAGPFAV